MKKLLSALSLLFILVGCSQNDVIDHLFGIQQEIKLTSNITAQTRGVVMDEQETLIANNQQVGVTITGASKEHNNVTWTSDGFGNLENSGAPVYYAGSNTANIYAYQPYNAAWTDVVNSSYTFTVADDQSAAGYVNSDLLWTTASANSSETAVLLTFKHMLAKINVYVTAEDGTDLSNASITLTNVEKSVDFQNGVLSAHSGNVGEIIAGVNTPQATAIVVPQALPISTSFITVAVGSKNYTYTTKSARDLISGKSYTYHLKITGNELVLDKADVDPWDNEDVTDEDGDLDEDESNGVSKEYLSFTALEDNCTVYLWNQFDDDYEPNVMISYDKVTWDYYYSTIRLNTGETVYIKGYYPDGFSKSDSDYTQFITQGQLSVQGNIMSLLYGDDFAKKRSIPNNYCFKSLFSGTSITSAPELPATSLTPYCYSSMFNNCQSLTTAPELPATSLAEGCYYGMFMNSMMLENAPKLPATSLAPYCYKNMFNACRKLTTAPELRATSLADNCYEGMFWTCYVLTSAPELPATSLAPGCYKNMFTNCKKLSSVKASFISVPEESCIENWLNLTPTNGTFYRNPDAIWINKSDAGIPEGWEVVNY